MASAKSFSNSMEPVITEIPSVTPQKLVDDLNISSVSESMSSSWLPSNNNYILYFLIVVILLFLGFNFVKMHSQSFTQRMVEVSIFPSKSSIS